MKTSRQRILEYIQAQRTMTIKELSDVFHSTEANIRHHLSILQQDGLITVVGERSAAGRGRPSQVFGPSKHHLGNNLDLLVDALLSEIEASLPEAVQQRLLEKVSTRLSTAIQVPAGSSSGGEASVPPASQGLPSPLRLIQAVQQLNMRHYQARWEARPDAPRVILGHCPFAAVIDNHPWLCQMDTSLLEGLLGHPLEQVARLAPDGRGGKHCIFRFYKE